ncbi:hypothetical protein K432DRAFT_397435 [Lepidopterella palustris CBS 459.81]|uniref:Uncharacterized protein n=1 Tax=Lepidopterella palustris CBS 459.81 TaxID=1314670 RepID=A0A8E2JAG3_9PEZI|nr:hypothetical protein K432DRAFT_397435 [Lepidopterella palustris CBS 459.81]
MSDNTDLENRIISWQEQEYLGGENGTYKGHEERIRILEANKATYALEMPHVAEVAAGRESSAWNEETNDWGPMQEDQNFEQEEEAEKQGQEQEEQYDNANSDMDIESDSD